MGTTMALLLRSKRKFRLKYQLPPIRKPRNSPNMPSEFVRKRDVMDLSSFNYA
jgi:hypothetical protein